MYRHKKQTGGAGQFAEVHMRIDPQPRGAGFEFTSEIFGGSISRNFWPSIEKASTRCWTAARSPVTRWSTSRR